nr:RHS repeat-associated core domain-containing protein [Akkermansia glycaniphila]
MNPSDDPYKNSLVGIIRNNNQDQALTQQKRHIDNSCIQIVGHSFLVINVPIYNSRSELAADNIQPGGNRSYIYSGYVQIAEIDATNEDAPQVVKTYLWDPSEPVATRVLHMTVWNNGTEVESLYYTHDLQKNVTALFGQAAGRRAQYEHDLYGNPINTTGDAAGINPYRYSSEYHDEDLDLIYYNYRHYNPTDGRWINRDSIAEQGGRNLYGFVHNRSSSFIDVRGLRIVISDKASEKFEVMYDDKLRKYYEPVRRSLLEEMIDQWDALMYAYQILDALNQFVDDECGRISMKRVAEGWEVMITHQTDGCKHKACGSLLLEKLVNKKDTYIIERVTNDINSSTFVTDLTQTNEDDKSYMIYINPQCEVNLTCWIGTELKTGLPILEQQKTPFAIILWHELVAHAFIKESHSKMRACNDSTNWLLNYHMFLDKGRWDLIDAHLGFYGDQVDQVIMVENWGREFFSRKNGWIDFRWPVYY